MCFPKIQSPSRPRRQKYRSGLHSVPEPAANPHELGAARRSLGGAPTEFVRRPSSGVGFRVRGVLAARHWCTHRFIVLAGPALVDVTLHGRLGCTAQVGPLVLTIPQTPASNVISWRSTGMVEVDLQENFTRDDAWENHRTMTGESPQIFNRRTRGRSAVPRILHRTGQWDPTYVANGRLVRTIGDLCPSPSRSDPQRSSSFGPRAAHAVRIHARAAPGSRGFTRFRAPARRW